MAKVLKAVSTPGGVVPTVFALVNQPATPMNSQKQFVTLQNKVNRQSTAFANRVANQITKAGTRAGSTNFTTKLARESAVFNAKIARENVKLSALDPNAQAALASSFTSQIPAAYQSAPAPLTAQQSATDAIPYAVQTDSGGALVAGGSGSDQLTGIPAAPSGESVAPKSTFPTWAKWTLGITGGVALIGYVKYRSITAPFRKVAAGVGLIANSGAPRAAGSFVRKVTGG